MLLQLTVWMLQVITNDPKLFSPYRVRKPVADAQREASRCDGMSGLSDVSGNKAKIDEIAEECSCGGQDEAGGSALVDEEEKKQAGQRDQREQDGREVDQPRPGLAGVSAFMEVVDDGYEAVADFDEVVVARLAVDGDIGRVAGRFERDGDLIVVDAKVGDGAMQLICGAEPLDDLELFRVCMVGGTKPVLRHLTDRMNGLFLIGKPVGVIQGKTGDGEEQDDGKRPHREIDMEPASNDGGFAAQMSAKSYRLLRARRPGFFRRTSCACRSQERRSLFPCYRAE